MRVLLIAESWPTVEGVPLDAAAAAQLAATAWTRTAPHCEVAHIGVGDGGPRSAEAVPGPSRLVGGTEVREVLGTSVMMPARGQTRWSPQALAAGLLGLAADHTQSQGRDHSASASAHRVMVPLGDVAPAGDATDLWGGGPDALRKALRPLDIVALVGSDRPLLGFHGMSAAVRDGREADAALAVAAQEQERRWAEVARGVDPEVRQQSLVGPARLSDLPGTGAAGGLSYALAAVGARLTDAAPALVALSPSSQEPADLYVAMVRDLPPSGLDHGAAPAAAQLAARVGAPCVVVAPEVAVGKRDLMAAGIAGAHEAGMGADALAASIARVAQTWTPA